MLSHPHQPLITILCTGVAACAIASCTLDPGEPWGYLDVDLAIDAVPNSGDMTIVEQSITVGEMQLRAPGASTDAVADFDPSDPPPGFTLCHQNHCHHEDGYTVSYDDIEAGIGVDSQGPVNVARRSFDAHHNLDAPITISEQFRIVDEVSLNETALTIEELSMTAEIEDDGELHTLNITLAMASRPISTGIAYDVGRDSPERQQADLNLAWPGDLFEDLTHLQSTLDDATSTDIAVHGTQNSSLRDELVARITDDVAFQWIEDTRD